MPDHARTSRELDLSARKWLIKTARQNLWRVFHWMDLDDLVSDGVLCWQIVVNHYPHVTERRQLMALFKTTYTNHIHRLANQRTRHPEELPASDLIDTDKLAILADRDVMQFIIEEAPPMLRRSLLRIVNDPDVFNQPLRRWLNRGRETTNEFLCRLANADPRRYDLHRQLNALIGRQQNAATV